MSNKPNTLIIDKNKFSEINISDIYLDDDRYQISFLSENINFIANSIKLTGLSNPPLVRPVNDHYVVVSGLSTIKAYIKNNNETIIVQETSEDIDECICLMKSITSIISSRELSNAELILSIKKLNQYLNPDTIAAQSKTIFNTNLNLKFIKKILTIANMPEPCLKLVHGGQLSIKSAERISGYPLEIQKIFLHIFSIIKASNSTQLEIIQNLFEITAREKTSMDLLFKNKQVLSIFDDNETNPGQKASKFRDYLNNIRFPTIITEQKRLNQKIASLKLGNTIKILPPPNFESQLFNFGFTAKSMHEFQDRIKTLKDCLNNTILNEIFKK